MQFGERPVQTKVKHIILSRYASGWAGIIANGTRPHYLRALEQDQPFVLDLVYVDGFGGWGRYKQDFDGSPGPLWGSPIIGVQALEAQAAKHDAMVRVSAIVMDQGGEQCAALVKNLNEAGIRTPVVETAGLSRESYGHVNVIRGDFRERIDEVLAWLGPSPFALFFIDPYGQSMRMKDDMHKILGREKTDAITLFPYYVNEVRGGSAAKPETERVPTDWQNIANLTAHFGIPEWEKISARPGLTADAREEEYVRLYLAQLRAADRDLIVKNIPLQLGEIDRTAYHLCLTTRDGDGAMKMNDVLRGAEVLEKVIRWRGQEDRTRRAAAASEQVSLDLDVPFIPPPATRKEIYDAEDVAPELRERLAGQTLTLKQVYRVMADQLFTASEIQKGLRLLKEQGLAEFESLNGKSAQVRVAQSDASPKGVPGPAGATPARGPRRGARRR